jgi:CRP/FNR family transcriptional activator FtrB
VELFSRHGKRETTLAICRPVTTFILAAVVGDLPYLASGRTLEQSRILMLPAENVRAVFDADAGFARAIVRELSRSFRGVMKELKSQKLRTSAQKLANWILVQGNGSATDRFELPFEKRVLAALLGMTPENLSRSLSQLRAHGVSFDRSAFVIEDAARLRIFADPSPSLDDEKY